MADDATRQATAMRQAVLLLAFLFALAAMILALFRGADLLHAAFVALWVLPVASAIIYQVFRTWFLVLMKSIHEKRLAQEQQAAEPAPQPNPRSPAGRR